MFLFTVQTYTPVFLLQTNFNNVYAKGMTLYLLLKFNRVLEAIVASSAGTNLKVGRLRSKAKVGHRFGSKRQKKKF